nr:hypothetical protein [Tanacetum cinerariifolium]
MDTTIDQQVAIDEALVPHAQMLRIRRSNFRMLLDIKSKESTLQLVYVVLRICPFFKAFLVVADLPEIYIDMLHICPRVHGQTFVEPSFEEEILAFIRFFGHSVPIKMLTDVNINKLYQPWRSFTAIINKFLTGKSSGYDSLRLSQAQILWGLYHKRNVDYAYLMWEDFVYQVEHKNQKKSNEMYYPRLTKVIINHFMSKDPSIPRRNKVNWNYVRDDFMFSTIKLVSRHQNTQQFDALLPIELTNDEIRNSNAYKEYYALATGEAAPKPKASVRRTRSSSDTSITPLTTTQMHISHASDSDADEGTGSILGVPDVPTDESEEELLWNSTDDEGADEEGKDSDDDEEDEGDDGEEGNGDEDDDGEEGDDDDDQEVVKNDDKDDAEESGDDDEKGKGDEQEYGEEDDEETRDKESFDPIPQTPKSNEDDGNGANDIGLNLGEEEEHVKEEKEDELYRDVNINQGRGLQATLEVEDTHVTLTPVKPDDVQTPTFMAPIPITTPTMTSSTIATTTTTTSQALILPTTIPSDIIQNLLSFGSLFCFDDRLWSLEENFSEVMQTNQFAGAVSAIPRIVQQYMDQRMNEAVKVSFQIQSDRLRGEAQRENDEFLRTVDDNIKKIIKEQVKEQVKILIEKMEGNKSIQRSDEQRNLYKAFVDAYESDKIILDTYGKTITLKRRGDDDEDKDEEPSAGPDRWSKRCREGKEPESASTSSKTATRSAGRADTLTPELLAGPTYDLIKGSCKSLIELEYHLEEVYKAITDQLD